jgi:hypothetical protein
MDVKQGDNVAGAIIARFAQALVGRRCAVEEREHDWIFDFGRGWVLEVAAAWRLVGRDGVIFADRDHDAERLRTWPLGGDTFAGKALKRKRVAAVDVDPLTGDLSITFDDSLRLQIFNNSAAYEGWQANFGIDGHNVALVGMAGGGVAFVGVVSAGFGVEEALET